MITKQFSRPSVKMALSDELLMKVEQPARYLGNEVNAANKDKSKAEVSFCMCFPDVYEIGMSHLGIQILYDMFNHFVKKYAAGPEDFLAYIDHAALVLSSSFHGTAFSLIYHKPFYVLNGINDNRISEILNKTNMTERSLESIEDIKNVNLNKPDEKMIDLFLENERVRSELYLREAIGK